MIVEKRFATLSLSLRLMGRRTRRSRLRCGYFYSQSQSTHINRFGEVNVGHEAFTTRLSRCVFSVHIRAHLKRKIYFQWKLDSLLLSNKRKKIQLTRKENKENFVPKVQHRNMPKTRKKRVEPRKKLRHSCAIGDVHNSSMLFNFHQFTRAPNRMELKLIIESLKA